MVPVPKTSTTSSNHLRCHSQLIKGLQRLVLSHLRPVVSPFLDPLQVAYQTQVGVDDAVIHLLQKAHEHLDQNKSTLRITFFDFTIQTEPGREGGKNAGGHIHDRPVMDHLQHRERYVAVEVASDVETQTGSTNCLGRLAQPWAALWAGGKLKLRTILTSHLHELLVRHV